jgi:hypothetical protein
LDYYCTKKVHGQPQNERIGEFTCVRGTVFAYDHLYLSGGNFPCVKFKSSCNVTIICKRRGDGVMLEDKRSVPALHHRVAPDAGIWVFRGWRRVHTHPGTACSAGIILGAMRLSQSWEDRYWRASS